MNKLISAISACILISIYWIIYTINREPMIDKLPKRYEHGHFDIWREGAFTDYTMCLRVKLNPIEVREFLPKFFGQSSIGVMIDMTEIQTNCRTIFWPSSFTTKTIALEPDTTPTPWGTFDEGSGAVYERGYLYVWSYSY